LIVEKTIQLGKVDYWGRGRKVNAVEITARLSNAGRLSITGGIWNGRSTDYVNCGQNLETILELFPNDPKVQRIVEIWRKWHLNDMQAGTPRQMEYVRDFGSRQYTETCEILEYAGLLYDHDYDPQGNPVDEPHPEGYKFGSRWLKSDLPDSIRAEVEELFS
jgi:hypothetical protein